MDTHLRILALKYDDVYDFVEACNHLHHRRRQVRTDGEGWRELVRFWYRVQRERVVK